MSQSCSDGVLLAMATLYLLWTLSSHHMKRQSSAARASWLKPCV